jgi:hypothetical protein
MADGAGLAFDQIARMQIVELDRRAIPAEGCSTLVVKAGDRLLIGHNEDGKSTDDVFVLKTAYDSGPSVLSVCYCASLPGHSLNINSHGLLTLCNALTARDRRMGEPKRLVCRRVMECSGIDETVELLRNTRRAQGQNWLLVQGERIVDVESSAAEMHVREIEGTDYHCNNYLYEGMSSFEGAKPDGGTFTRSAEARKVMGSLRTIEDLHAALSSHENSPHCFCRHEQGRTLAAILVDCTERRVWIGHGPRCEAEMVEFDSDSLGQARSGPPPCGQHGDQCRSPEADRDQRQGKPQVAPLRPRHQPDQRRMDPEPQRSRRRQHGQQKG